MKCINCGKIIPNTSSVCPSCNKDPLVSENVNNTPVINNNNIEEKKGLALLMSNKLIKKIFIGVVVFILLLIIMVIGVTILGNKTKPYQIYNKFVNQVEDNVTRFLDDVYQGTYNLELYVNDEGYDSNGKYSMDLSKRYFSVEGNLDDPSKKNGEIIVNSKELNYEFLINELNMYFKSEKISDKPIFVPLNNYSTYLNKKVDYETIVSSLSQALRKAFMNVTYDVSSEEYDSTKVNKYILTFNSEQKYNFYKTLYSELIDDSSYLSEMKKIYGTDEEEIIKTYENYIENYKRAKNESTNEIKIIIYANESNIKEINYNNEFILKIDNNKYSFEINEKIKKELSITINSEEHQEYMEYKYVINYKEGGTNINANLKIRNNIDSKLNKYEYDEFININEMNSDSINQLKSKFNYYINNNEWIDKLTEVVKERCTKDLECTCEDGRSCTCKYENRFISCDYDKVK